MNKPNHRTNVSQSSRRELLTRIGGGFGAIALSSLLQTDLHAASTASSKSFVSPLAPKRPHNPATAKSIIFLFMEGGPSHLDTFDPKPALNKLAGKPLPKSFGPVITAMGESGAPLLGAPRKWKQHGQSGLWVSDWLPHTARHVDDLCVIRSCWADGLNHVGSVCQMNTGSVQAGRPSLGSWAIYGLGSENKNLPAFVVMTDRDTMPFNGVRNWGTGFMPATYQGARFKIEGKPIPNLTPPKNITDQRQRRKLALLSQMNHRHAAPRIQQSELDARIHAYELAFRMQTEAPKAVDLSKESRATKDLYGLEDKATHAMAKSCIMARRLVERGVRFVQVFHGTGSKWDTHTGHEKRGPALCKSMDQPVAGLLTDLKQRGMLEDTLVVWGGEFGRTPMSEKGHGRDHNPYGFTMWMAGGGTKGGQTVGTTDELGLRAVEDRAHVHDLHATILHTLGIEHNRLVYAHNGRRETPTVNEGSIITKALLNP